MSLGPKAGDGEGLRDNDPEDNSEEGTGLSGEAFVESPEIRALQEQVQEQLKAITLDLTGEAVANELLEEPLELERKVSLELHSRADFAGDKYREQLNLAVFSAPNIFDQSFPLTPILPLTSTPLVASNLMPGDEYSVRTLGPALYAHNTRYSGVFTRVYPTHRLVLTVESFKVINRENSVEQFAAIFFEAYEREFAAVQSVTGVFQSLVHVLTDAVIGFDRGSLVPVSFGLVILCNEDEGFAEIRPTGMALVVGNMLIFAGTPAEVKQICDVGNFLIGTETDEDPVAPARWCYFGTDDLVVIHGTNEQADLCAEDVQAVLQQTTEKPAVCAAIPGTTVVFDAREEPWHIPSFLQKPTKEWRKPAKAKP